MLAANMQRKWILAAGIVLVILGVGGFFLRGRLVPSQAGLQIETTPQSTVFLDGEQVGTTPYDTVKGPGETIMRLVPISTNGGLAPWGTKITLTSGVKTVVKRDFGETEAKSAGEVLSFETVAGKLAQLAVVSSPDSAQVVVDGEVRGFTPIKVSSLPVGEHKIVISRPGFADREINARAEAGYKLTVEAMLAEVEEEKKDDGDAISDEEKSADGEKALVEILDTPTGFLRVRMEPTTQATESAQVDPGETFTYIEENEGGTWFKIEYEDGKEGWISATYAKKVGEDSSSDETKSEE
ncbi:hypothetical protein CMO96_03280 [Candidatus Woesebacteria bacterium]|nr:hypothetical protein [Candidatus Woesebacteria bacterium]